MTGTIKLQGIAGQQTGKAVKDLKVGDVLVWNYGYKSEVVESIPSKTGKTITAMLRSQQDGQIRARKMKADSLVVVEQKEEPENDVERAIKKRTKTYNGIYSDIGIALEKFTTEDLLKFYIEKYGDSSIRYFLEQQIIAGEISKEKYA